MAMHYYVVISLYCLIIVWILSFTYLFRTRISCMNGMMVAMAIGMIVGIQSGVLIGMLFPAHFFEATMISMLIAGMIGAVFGLPISLMAVLDGLLSGFMGGMMGAMMGVMIPADMFTTVTQVLTVLSVTVLFLVFLMIQNEVKLGDDHSLWVKMIFGKPYPMFIFICILLYTVHHLPVVHLNPKQDHLHSFLARFFL